MTKAMILAAGFGTRLWPLTEDRTKPAIPFLNRPLIAYSVEYLARYGIRDIIINLHHQPDSIREALGDGSDLGVNIEYSYEEEILGTSGAIDRVRDRLIDDNFIVINGKIVTDIDLNQVMATHRDAGAIATLVLRDNAAREHFSVVEVDSHNRIMRFAGFPEPIATEAATAEFSLRKTANTVTVSEPAPLMFTGIQVLSPRIFEYVPRDQFSHSTTHVYPRAIERGEAVIAHVAEGNWYEMSTLDRYLAASLLFMDHSGANLVRGPGCKVSDEATVEETVLWKNVTVEPGARVRKAVLADGVRVPSGSVIEDAVVVRREIVDEVERGEVVGDNLIVPL